MLQPLESVIRTSYEGYQVSQLQGACIDKHDKEKKSSTSEPFSELQQTKLRGVRAVTL
jgi:hypothetical protein